MEGVIQAIYSSSVCGALLRIAVFPWSPVWKMRKERAGICVGLSDPTTTSQGKPVIDKRALLFNADKHTATLLHPLCSRTEGNKKMEEKKTCGFEIEAVQ